MVKFSKTMERFRPHRIWHQIFFILMPLVILPLAVLGGLMIATGDQAIRRAVQNDYRELAVRAAGEVNESIMRARELLTTTASVLGVLHADMWRQETVVTELALEHSMLQRVASVDMHGREIATSDLGASLRDRSGETAFQQARGGTSYMSELKIIAQGPAPVVTMAVPIRQSGLIRGVLMAEVNLRRFWDIVDAIRIGKTGQAYVVNQKGAFISHPDKKRVLENKNFSHQAVMTDILNGKNGSREEKDPAGKPWLLFYAPIRETGWGLILFQSAQEAYSGSHLMRLQSRVLIVLSIFATLLVSFFLSRFMSGPVNMLLEGTRRIARGDFDHPLEVHRQDEMGQLLTSFNDMTEKVKEARRLEKLSVIGRAATAIAHELKNSLVLVNTYMQLLFERYQDKNFIMEFCRIVPQELSAWKGMLQNVIDYAKPQHFPLQEVDINSLINDIATLAEARVKQYKITFVIKTQKILPLIHGNAEKLRQVVLNLISNALEATPAGGTIMVTTDFSPRLGTATFPHVVIGVHNTGEGIPPDKRERIFDPFYSTKTGGLGLGLSVSKEIVERHGGLIGVENEKEKKTSFYVRIPTKANI